MTATIAPARVLGDHPRLDASLVASSVRPTKGVTEVSKRNMIWLAVVIAAGVIAWLTVGIVAGLVVAAVMLAVSEIVERRACAQRRRAATTPADADAAADVDDGMAR